MTYSEAQILEQTLPAINKLEHAISKREKELENGVSEKRLISLLGELQNILAYSNQLSEYASGALISVGLDDTKEERNIKYLAFNALTGELYSRIKVLLVSAGRSFFALKGESEDLSYIDSWLSAFPQEEKSQRETKTFNRILTEEAVRLIKRYVEDKELDEESTLYTIKNKAVSVLQDALHTDETDLRSLLDRFRGTPFTLKQQ